MGGKTSTTTQKVTIPKEVMARYNAVNARAENVASTPFQQYSTNPSDFVAQLNAQQYQGIDAVNNAAGAYRPYFDQAASTFAQGLKSAQPQALNLEQFLNPYQSQVIDATIKQMGQANEQAQSGALGTAISSGAFGGDRAGIAAANLANQQGLAMGSTLAGLNAQNYNQALQAAQQQQGLYLGATQADLERMMQGGQFYAGLGTAAQQAGLQGAEAQINAGTLAQQTEQAGKSALYNQFQQQQAYPFQVAQFLANIAMGTGALSGSTTTTTQPSSFWSDRRLKEDIQRIGHTDDGLPIYKYKYKGDDAHQTHIGFMADEVEQHKPEAVGVAGNGYKYVDYDRATKAGGGGVAGPYGAAFGSQNPYAAGYVPQATLPVGELMVADPSALQNAEQTMAQQLEAMNSFGDTITGLKDKYDAARKWWNGDDPDTTSQRDHDRLANWRGGVAGYADGGAAYLSARGGLNPVDTRTYLSDTLDDQKKRDDELMHPNGTPQQGKSGLENVVDLGKMAMNLFGFERGGVVGRHGYATDGGVETDEQRRLKALTNSLGLGDPIQPSPQDMGTDLGAAVRSLGDDAVGYGAGKVDPRLASAAGLGTARLPQPEVPQPSVALPNPPTPQLPAGGVAAAIPAPPVDPLATSPRPQPLPAGLVPAPRPDADVINTAGAAITQASGPAPTLSQPEIDPRDFYRTNILKQESGNRQFDENGKPLTSSAGAIGIGQILPSTGPEAAKLAGLPWDENRFYNDADYNAALGEAYFMHQYQTFGSIDKAAAAYNAGPGALSSAIDRATAVGGSYLDYLPAETQKYVLATTGQGGSGGLAGGSGPDRINTSGGVTGGYGIGGDKPYAERDRLGQMFYDRDGRVNKDALLSILSGIGTMASSPSRYLGASILQGIGGAANTYMAREQQRQDITSKSMANANAFLSQYERAKALGYVGTPQQYADAIGYTGPVSSADGVGAGTKGSINSYNGVPLDAFGRGMNMPTTISVNGKPVEVMAGQTYGYLKALEAKLTSDVALGIQGADQTLAQVQTALANHKGQIVLADGRTVVTDPTYEGAAFGATSLAGDLDQTAELRKAISSDLLAAQEGQRNAAELGKALSMLPSTGNLSGWFSTYSNIGQQLGLNVDTDAATGYEVASKVIAGSARDAVTSLAGKVDTNTLDGLIRATTPNPDMSPAAIEELLAIQSGIADYNLALANAKMEAQRLGQTNLAEVEREFTTQNRPADFIDARRDEFKGTIKRPAAAASGDVAEGSTSVDGQNRPIVYRNGKWELQ